jgi:FkbM family methyltransferase
MHTRDILRTAAAQVISRVPDIRGRGRLAYLANQLTLPKVDSGFTAEVTMRLGHHMLVDLRARTEYTSFYTHDYDNEDIRMCLRLLQRDSVVFDVGANVGFWTVPMALTLRGGGQVHAFEPLPANAKRLQENVELNDVGDFVAVHEVGLSDKASTVEISLREDFSNGSGTGNAAIVIDDSDRHFRCTQIQVVALDNIFQSLMLERLDFMKVDIEGHEDRFLEGASSVIARFRPIIYMEINEPYYNRRGLDPTDLFQSWLDSAGYTCALRGPGGWSPKMLRRRKPVLDNVLLLPTERLEDILPRLRSR